MTNGAYGIGTSAANYLDQGFGQYDPFSPAGMTDAQRQGMNTWLEGIGSQYDAAQNYADAYGGFTDFFGNFAGSYFGQPSPQFSSRFGGGGGYYGGGGGGGGAGAGADYANLAAQYFGQAVDPSMFQQATGMTQGALQGVTPGMQQAVQDIGGVYGSVAPGVQQAAGSNMGIYGSVMPGLQSAANLAGQTAGLYGYGWNPEIAGQINQTGASFDPFNNPALAENVSLANELLARDFQQGAMQDLNAGLSAAGSGSFGGTRAGVAQGIAEQGLADAMQRQTTDMLARGYEAGLDRYVADRATTVQNAIAAGELGASVGLGAAGQLADVYGTQGALGLQAVEQQASQLLGLGNLGTSAAGQQAAILASMGEMSLDQAMQVANIADQLGGLNSEAGQAYIRALNQQVSSAATRYAASQAAQASIASSQAAANASRYGADTSRYIAELQDRSDMQQYLLGMYPDLLTGQYGAEQQPGELMTEYGQALYGYGGEQQAANQAVVDYYNNLANQMADYPAEALSLYTQLVNNITRQAGQTGTTTGEETTTQANNPWLSGLGGAVAGYRIGENLNK